MPRNPIWISFVFITLIITSCMHTRPSGADLADRGSQTPLQNPVESVTELESDISDARLAEINVLSPDSFQKAEKAFFRAQSDLEKGNEISDIQESVTESRFHLKKAYESADVSNTTLAEVIKARNMAVKAGAARFEKDYRRLEKDFQSLTRAIEKGNLSYAQKNRGIVIDGYHELEIRAITEENIGKARSVIALAEAGGARKIAPVTHAETVSTFETAEAFIAAHPYDEKGINGVAKDSLFAAHRLLTVTEQSSRFRSMEPEDIVLYLEKQLHTIAIASEAPDMRNQDYATQLDNIIGSIQAMEDNRILLSGKNQDLQAEMEAQKMDYLSQIDALNVQLATLEGKTLEDQMAKERLAKERLAMERQMAEERSFNALYLKVRSYFKIDEAEVYKQESQLVIRLKAMHFPVGKSAIMPQNYELLNKVQRAIQAFDDPRVVVEGHTDATGPEEVNMQLSQQRAESVREYMIDKRTLLPETISAVGYGSRRPLASNATSVGRDINRRIDILILSETKPM